MTKMSEPYLPPRKWTSRKYPFHELKVGDQLFVEISQRKYFRSAASGWFRSRPTMDYMTVTTVRNGVKGVLLTRMR